MNIVKKLIAVITVAIIAIRIFMIETFAFAGAPVIAAEEITALLETALVGSGLYTESELEGKSYFELNELLKDGINSGQINPKTNYYTDPISEIQYNLLDLLSKPEVQAGIDVSNALLNNVLNDAFGYWITDSGTGVNINYENLQDKIYFTPTVDLNGKGCLAIAKWETSINRIERYIYGDFGYIDKNPDGVNAMERLMVCSNENPSCYVIDYYYDVNSGDLTWTREQFVDNPLSHMEAGDFGHERQISSINYYGDWRTVDDTPIETDDTSIPVIGEADGTQVTPDMLNPDGSVTIGDTTYYPEEYIDWDKFKDPAIIDLLNDILTALENIPVVSEQDKPIVDVDNMEVTVPEELSDYTVPVGIANVFPFSLPFDFSRGIKMLLAKPEVPVFKTEIDMTDFCGFDLGVIPLEISLEEWEPAVVVIRWFMLLLFIFSLIFISTKIVKGAGA